MWWSKRASTRGQLRHTTRQHRERVGTFVPGPLLKRYENVVRRDEIVNAPHCRTLQTERPTHLHGASWRTVLIHRVDIVSMSIRYCYLINIIDFVDTKLPAVSL